MSSGVRQPNTNDDVKVDIYHCYLKIHSASIVLTGWMLTDTPPHTPPAPSTPPS